MLFFFGVLCLLVWISCSIMGDLFIVARVGVLACLSYVWVVCQRLEEVKGCFLVVAKKLYGCKICKMMPVVVSRCGLSVSCIHVACLERCVSCFVFSFWSVSILLFSL